MQSSWNTYAASEELRDIRGAAADAVILGSGLAALAELAAPIERIPYGRLSCLCETSVEGHPGFMSLARIAGEQVLLVAGRFHAYVGIGADGLAAPVLIAAQAGCRRIIVTQAAGSLKRSVSPGTWLLATDVVRFPTKLGLDIGRAACRGGAAGAAPGAGAPIVSRALSAEIREAARAVKAPLAEGVLCWTSGPTYETAAEARAAELMGADAATMSSLPELLAARHLGIEAASLGWITNYTAHVSGKRTDHAGVVGLGAAGARMLRAILVALLPA
ncbi:MAG: hypothetical protein PHD74_07010, partial [Candidatus Krumholzibacteria bacterium]|nr:hypothetical protein [Candidatus Krumholzibacteria bacterium]